jgi:hypothetical protein
MRSNVSTNINAADASVNASGSIIDVNQVFMISAQCISTGSSTGSVQLQISNDLRANLATDANGYPIPVNWSSLGSPATVTAGSVTYIAATQVCGQFVRALYTKNNGSAGTITVNINTQAY